MKNVKVSRVGSVVKVTIDNVQGANNSWTPELTRNTCNEFHADLEVNAIRAAIKAGRDEEVQTALANVERMLGRGKLGKKFVRKTLDEIRGWYS